MKAGAIGNLTRVSWAALACSASFAVLADPPTDVMNIVRETDIKWVANPLVPGLASAVVQGNPSDSGNPYVIRVHFAPNTMSPLRSLDHLIRAQQQRLRNSGAQ